MSLFGKQLPPKDGISSRNSVGLRLNIFFFGTFFIFCIIIVRLAGLQFTEGALLSEEETSRETKIVPLAAMRGIIFAAEGEQIAYSTPTESLYLTLTKDYTARTTDKVTGVTSLTEKAKYNSDMLAARLAADFAKYGDPNAPKLTQQDILDSLDLDFKKYLGYVPRRIKTGLIPEEIAYFMEHKDNYPGLTIVEESVRHYDKDTVAVQTVGFGKPFKSTEDIAMYKNVRSEMKKDSPPGLMYKAEEYVGFDGLEMQYQRELRGENGYQVISVTPQNMAEKVEQNVAPVKGNNIWMTINKKIQMKTEQAILDQIKWLHTNAVQGETHPDALTGYAVAMEVETGNIVAMASMPDYDSNVWTKDSLPTPVWNKIMNNHLNGTITSNSSGRSGHDFSSLVFMGSTIKPLSVLIGLKEGFFNTSTTYSDVGITYFGKDNKSSVRNSSGHVYGSLDPAKAIKNSSNVFMIDMVGKQLYKKYPGDKGIEVWDRYMKEFGLGVSTKSGLPGESAGQINYTDLKAAGSSQAALIYASFGQQGSYTTLQLAQYASTLANEGVRIKPQLVSKITDAQGKAVKEFQREVLNTVTFDKSYWKEIKQGMSSEVSAFDDFPYDFARKTGTSEKTDRKNINRDNGVFIAFAPRENPKLAVAVVIPEGGFGSKSAAPVARKIFDAYDWEYGLDGVPKKNVTPASDPVQE
ncbi:peptidoglycan D,D-transpeptidase FtsI family protein [Paenibacillus sp. B2(2019)]|uniref:peptidoglycan D,D-transpeptidase FtsI family protein n=1 Tax=Paenibacillus sp. B2(2019) TaxID=2607754 RepID=UPI0011F1413A|nr:penicillin-binding transpeptidase domain-containing protein [Paenibacillus sp. B2(2019)]KAA1187758.1 penicillin-binding protein 2 [Paenibacillus sp. B2(2019)]